MECVSWKPDRAHRHHIHPQRLKSLSCANIRLLTKRNSPRVCDRREITAVVVVKWCVQSLYQFASSSVVVLVHSWNSTDMPLSVPPWTFQWHYLNRRLNTSKIQRITIRTVVGFAQHVDFFLPWSWPVREQFFSPWAYRISKFASNGTFFPYRQFEFFLIFKLVLHN